MRNECENRIKIGQGGKKPWGIAPVVITQSLVGFRFGLDESGELRLEKNGKTAVNSFGSLDENKCCACVIARLHRHRN
jgi:hypothetical protein